MLSRDADVPKAGCTKIHVACRSKDFAQFMDVAGPKVLASLRTKEVEPAKTYAVDRAGQEEVSVGSSWKYCPGETPKADLNTAMKALGPE